MYTYNIHTYVHTKKDRLCVVYHVMILFLSMLCYATLYYTKLCYSAILLYCRMFIVSQFDVSLAIASVFVVECFVLLY